VLQRCGLGERRGDNKIYCNHYQEKSIHVKSIASQIYKIIEDTRNGNTVTAQLSSLKPSLVKTTEFELQKILTYSDRNVVV